MVPLELWTSLAMMALCADVLPPGAEPVYPGHTALCQATPGEGEGPTPPAHLNPNMGLGDAKTVHGPMTLNTQNPVPCTLETTPVLGSSHIWFSPLSPSSVWAWPFKVSFFCLVLLSGTSRDPPEAQAFSPLSLYHSRLRLST